jgi:hypothetical protein
VDEIISPVVLFAARKFQTVAANHVVRRLGFQDNEGFRGVAVAPLIEMPEPLPNALLDSAAILNRINHMDPQCAPNIDQ